MFGKKKKMNGYEDEEREPVKPKKPIIGFRCSPAIHINAKELAKKFHVDLYVVAEHALQLGLMDVAAAMKNPEEMELLRAHLNEGHAMNHLVESVSQYDEEAAEYIREGQIRKYHKEKAVRDLIELWARGGLDPRDMRKIILEKLQEIINSHARSVFTK